MKMRKIKYGGAMVSKEEVAAISKSVNRSVKTGNWQASEEASKMEQEASKFLGVKYGVLTTSGSSAGLLALSALELPKGSEVIIPAVTFPTIFNIILQCDLVPVVVDCKVGTYNMDVAEVEKAISKKTKAIIAVHAVGNPVDMPALMKVAKKHKIYVIEDNCDGWGSTIAKKKVGSFGDVSITSFHAAHIVSMGVGGGVFSNNGEINKRVRMYRDWGRQANLNGKNKYPSLPEDYNPRFIYEKIGYNFQILELQAAMGRVQLRKANRIKKLRKKNFDYLYEKLAWLHDFLILPDWLPDADVCWFSFPLSVTPMVSREGLVESLEEHGIETRSMFAGNITKHPAYAESKYRIVGELEGANYILENSFWVSVHPRLTKKDLDYMVKVIESWAKRQWKR